MLGGSFVGMGCSHGDGVEQSFTILYLCLYIAVCIEILPRRNTVCCRNNLMVCLFFYAARRHSDRQQGCIYMYL